MNQIVRTSLKGEVLSPGDQVSVYGTTSPLNSILGARIHCRVRAGSSIMEILLEALSERPGYRLRRDFIVRVGDHEIPECNWAKVRVKPGAVVTFIPRLQGGANAKLLTSVLAVVIAVAAAAVSGPMGAALAASAFGTAIGISAAVASALIAGGIMLAGSLLISALFPVRPPPESVASDGSSFNSIQGARNQANPFGSVPVVLGRHRQSPMYAAKPYTLIVGDDQYLCMLFCWGYGPLVIEDLRIGETPLTSFSDYQVENRQGFVGDAPITLYPSNQFDEAALAIELDGPVDAQFNDGVFGPYNTQTTAANTDEIGIDFTAPGGVYATDQTGKEVPFHIKIEVQYRLAGLGGAWSSTLTTFLYRATDGTRVGMLIAVTRGQYEVRCRRATSRGAPELTKDQVNWTALRSIKHAPPVTFPKPLALTALRIKATGQLSGVIDTFNGITTSLVNTWSGASWVADTASQWPSDLFRHVLQGPANARPRADSAIDLQSLQDWKAYCISKSFKFNEVVSNNSGNANVHNKLVDIAAAGRAFVAFNNGKWGVRWDEPDDDIVDHFTPRNSWDFGLQRPYAQQPHGWRVKFINETNGFTADERIVYDDGYDSSNATLFEGLEFTGVTDPALIWKHGRFHIAQARLRPEKFTLSVGWEHLVCTRGDRVRVTHDVPLIGLASGRVKSVVGQVVTFDETVTIESGKTYGFQFRVPEDIRSFNRAVDGSTAAGDYNSLTLVGDLSLVQEGTLFGFGETGKETGIYRIQGISHQRNLIAVLTLVDDAQAISTADSGTIPDYNPNITIPPDPFTLPPRDLQYQEIIDGQGATARAMVRLTWQVPRFGSISSFEVQAKFEDSEQGWLRVDSVLPPRTTSDVAIDGAGLWSFRVRCLFADGTASDWTSLLNLTLQALSAQPDDVTNLHIRIVDGQTVLDWDIVDDQRQINYEIRKGTSWDTGLVVGDVVTQPPWATTGDGTYHVRAYVLSPFGARIYSENDASITVLDSIISRNIILSKDEQATGWTGGLQGGVIDGSFIRTDTGLSITLPWAQEVVDQLVLSGTHIAVYLSSTIVNIGQPGECRFWTEYEASGVLRGSDFPGQPDVLGSGDILGVSPTRFIRAFPIWRFADTGNSDIFGPSDVFDPADVFAADIDWGNWVGIASGTRVSRYWQPGFVLITDREDTDATGTKFKWFVDVPDRTDDYTNLSVPNTGLSITFYPGGYNATPTPGVDPLPFNGGPNGSTVPHVQRAIVNGTNGDEVKITSLTATGCTIFVVNGGVNQTRAGVNLLVRGY